ncbi:MAG: hypothetical protein HYY48_11675 [Gammaproteobacteria bacterium]|nr:hypothetical protein [Gammaproteobacteria bacterium]
MQTGTHSLLFQFLTTVFFWGGMIVLVIGAAMTVAPKLVIRLGEVLNRWVSTDEAFHSLDAPRSSERWFYRHHRVCGGLLILGAAYVLYTFAFAFDPAKLSRRIVLFHSQSATEWLLNSLSFINIAFSVLAMAIGSVTFLRPSLLKGLEQRANRWYGVDDSLKRLDVQLKAPDAWFRKRPRLLGLLIVAGSLYIVLSLGLFI